MTTAFKSIDSDMPALTWIDRWAPPWLRPYLHLARLDRPIGTWLLLLPCWWSIALATPGWPDPLLVALFAVGALIMRGAGCTLNDIADRDFDGRVARTATRPIPSGAVSIRQAFGFLGLQLLLGLSVLLQFNTFAVMVGAGSLVVVAVYPFMKRITYWPQVVLGLAFNWGALLGWAAVQGGLSAAAGVLYMAGILWTLGYDTIYAHQDKEDDILIGIKSTALKLGENTARWLIGFYSGTITLIALSGYLAALGWAFYTGLAFAAAHLIWQTMTLDIDDAKGCLARFKSNRTFGLIVFAAIIAGQVL
ncbi:MAG: 4-hydroxybenzoate octaprenyltransferase [Rhodospirillaceae bacterium]|jgi:4-hydroxybenzoate polyprenyltransferase|nr:4-hydroxybenzoate octaprenyltransferase [Rhodospirillaceae bacterium]MBT5244061.1 4-hydroxybenzoate octaprenyltransferase [Rhodospirillaceae bacterium]MBT5560881.1 4-hydroxybenzoate octaprenyltransferase [Rhodospirillaceae bacterium]MBT6241170.1 4-hydroxybenzoate octaprenyltransferase [Rhodospirillaceae bacterium]MBT7136527.1 4-hydroxybenzoate octaprenyltransferase [Rhodospirillaceae bacterium]